MKDRSIRVLTLVALVVLGIGCLARLRLTGTITHFVPSHADVELIELSLELVDSPLARRMVLSIEGGPERERVAERLAAALRDHPEVAWVDVGLDDAALRGIHALYFDRRFYLASLHPETEIPRMLSEPALSRKARRLRARLTGPEAALVARAAPGDPLGLFERMLDRIRDFQPPSKETTRAAPADHALVQLGLRSSPFDTTRQSDLLAFIEREFDRLAGSARDSLRLEQSGVNRFAVDSERTVRRDVSTISVVSTTVVCLLFLLVFRSPRHLLIAIMPPVAGFLVALAVKLADSEPVHGITLAFGFVLIGVAIDYPIHLMNHHALGGHTGTGQGRDRSSAPAREGEPRARGRNPLRPILGSLLLSGTTTILAFLSLSLSEFPGLGEMGTFAAIGIAVALVLTLVALPSFLHDEPRPSAVQSALSMGFVTVTDRLAGNSWLLGGGVAFFVGLAAIGLPRLAWQDDPSSFLSMDEDLLAEAQRVQARAGTFDGGRFVVGVAPTREAALVLNEQIHDRLRGPIASGALGGVGSLQSFLLSESLQRRNLAAFRSVSDLDRRIETAFVDHGFRPGAFATFTQAVTNPETAPLRPEDFENTPLERVLSLLVELDDRYGAITLLRGVSSGDAIARALEGLPGAYYVDQKGIMASIYAGYRHSTIRMLCLGGAVMLFVLLVRNPRRPVDALLAVLPAALGISATLGVLGLLGIPVSVVSAISLLVVLGMGVDYGIFAVAAAEDPTLRGPTLASLLVSCLTSVFVFGVLAISSQPVLRAFGLTTGIGVFFALLIAPGTLALRRRW